MAKASSSGGLMKFSVKQGAAEKSFDQTDGPLKIQEPIAGTRSRGKNARVGIAVRLGHEDWYRAHDLAVREHTSLQALIVAGLSELMKQRGLPPLSGQ